MGSSKRNLLTSILLLVVMGVFAVLTIFIVVDAINKKYYNDIKVEYEVQEESPNIILTFARNEGSNFGTDDTKVILNEDKTKFRIDGTVPTIENGIVTNLDDLTSSDGREFYFFSTNSSFIDPQEDPENPDFIFSESDYRYYVSTEDNPIWYDVPASSENLTLYSVFLTPNVHNSDFANAPLLNTSPNVIISHDVTEIPYNAFSNALMEGDSSMAAKIESVVIPNSTKSINPEVDESTGGGAFAACTTLTNVLIPGSVEYVGGEAFFACTGLDTVKYGNGYYLPTENNEHAILIDTNLKAENITIHEACISIQGNTFSKYISIMMGLITPGEEAAIEDYINMNLQEITIPKNVKNIGFTAFYMCMGLENVVFEDNSDLISMMGSFTQCLNLKTINLEDTKIKELKGTFSGCSSLTSITIPDSVTSIGNSAFNGCSSLTSITIPESVTSIGDSAFDGCSSLKTVDFGDNSQLTSIGGFAFKDCSSLTSITNPDSVTSIGRYAFYNCTGLTSIIFEDMTGLTSIGNYIFDGCDNINQLTIQSGEVKDLDFSALSNLTTVTLGNGVTSIGDYAFYECSSLTSITIPDSVTSIGNSIFRSCSSLTSIAIPDSVTSIGDNAFYNCRSLTSITIPSSVTSIGEFAFYYCYKLVEVYDLTGPEGLNITAGSSDNGYVARYADYVYTDINTPLVQKMVDDYIFYYNNGVMFLLGYTGSDKKLTLPSIDKVRETFTDFEGDTYEIHEYAFYENTNITSVVIPDSVTSIGDFAFRSCSSLTSITIPESVTSIRYGAFSYCDNLTIYCEASSRPSGWSSSWNNSNRPVYWAGEWEYVDGVPVPIESGVEGVGYSDIGEDFGIGFDGLGFREEIYFNDKRERKVV